jgi:hypothetical protein
MDGAPWGRAVRVRLPLALPQPARAASGERPEGAGRIFRGFDSRHLHFPGVRRLTQTRLKDEILDATSFTRDALDETALDGPARRFAPRADLELAVDGS